MDELIAQPLITKADGSFETFDDEKLCKSLLRAGATSDQAMLICEKIRFSLHPGNTTGHIYKRAFSMLKKIKASVAARYSLRRALAELGPSGFPFEEFISKLFLAHGYTARHSNYLSGKCAEHEVDLIAYNDEKFIMGELKFHNKSELKSDLKVVLYVNSRYHDLLANDFDHIKPNNLKPEGWVITNTKFTENAVSYAECAGLKLLGWSYPETGNLQDMIESKNLEPVTILTTLSKAEKQSLMQKGIVLCQDLSKQLEFLNEIIHDQTKKDLIQKELQQICNC